MQIKSVTIFKRSPKAKNYIVRYDDDTVSIRTLFLQDKKEDCGETFLCTKFGLHLYERFSGRLSKETIGAIRFILSQEIEENTVAHGKLEIR